MYVWGLIFDNNFEPENWMKNKRHFYQVLDDKFATVNILRNRIHIQKNAKRWTNW